MIKLIFAIKDTKLEYLDPFYSIDKKSVLVNVERAVAEDKIPFYSDKELWFLGTFNNETGEIVSSLEFVCQLNDFRKVSDDIS